MKTISKLSLVTLFALACSTTYAIDGDFLLNVKKRKGIEISFALNGQQKAKVSIYDTSNKVLFSENAVGKKGISKTYNLDEFPEGNYYLIVTNDFKSIKHTIKVNGGSAVLSKKPILEVYLKDEDDKKLLDTK